MNKKVVQLSSVHPATDTRIFYKISRSLVKAGYDVDLIIQHDQDEAKNGINIKALPIAKKKSDRIIYVFPSLIKKCLKYPKGTVFHFHDSELIPLCLIFRLLGYKIIYDIHEHTPKDFLTKDWLPLWLRYPLSYTVQFLEYLAGIFFNGIVTVVPPVTQRFEKRNNVEISNYPKLDDTYYYQLEKKQDSDASNTVVYIGSMTEVRGLTVMVDAINMVHPKYHAILKLGGKINPPELETELKKTRDWSSIRELGWLNMAQIWESLFTAKVGLVVLQPTPAHLVLESVKMFEYMAAGIPVICSDFPLYRNIIDDCNCGVAVDPTNPEAIAAAIEWMFEHPHEAKEMGVRGQKAILKKYNWKTEEQELLNFYSKI